MKNVELVMSVISANGIQTLRPQTPPPENMFRAICPSDKTSWMLYINKPSSRTPKNPENKTETKPPDRKLGTSKVRIFR